MGKGNNGEEPRPIPGKPNQVSLGVFYFLSGYAPRGSLGVYIEKNSFIQYIGAGFQYIAAPKFYFSVRLDPPLSF